MGKTRRGITIIEAVVVSSVTFLLGLAMLFITSGWAQIFAFDLTKKTNEHIQSFRSLLVIEGVNYTENGGEIFLRNISKFSIPLTIKEIELLKNQVVIDRVYHNITLAKNESTHLPVPIYENCKRGDNNTVLTYRVKYIPATSFEKDFPILVTEQNLTCPISIVPPICSLPDRWALIDVVDPITMLSGNFSKTYPIVWIRVPLSSIVDYETLKLNIYSRETTSLGSSPIKLPNIEKIPIIVSDTNVKPPYNVTFESMGVFLIPQRLKFGGLIKEDKVIVHVSGITLLWRPEDMVVEAIVIELGIFEPENYSITLKIKDCNGRNLFSKVISHNYVSDLKKSKVGWDYIFLELSKEDEFKITDIYLLETIITKTD